MTSQPDIPGVLTSQLLPGLFSLCPDAVDRPVRVLDLGAASGMTVQVFGQYRCRLQFCDLSEQAFRPENLPKNAEGEIDEDELVVYFRSLLDLADGSRFDICLFWDFLNQLDNIALKGFCRALKPHLHAETRGHGFAVLNKSSRLSPQRYALLSKDRIAVLGVDGAESLRYPRPQSSFNRLLEGLEITRGVLRGDGRLEIVLQTI